MPGCSAWRLTLWIVLVGDAPPHCLLRVVLEVMALIALHQPIALPEIKAVRSVSLRQDNVDVLLDAGLIRLVERRDASRRLTL